MSKHFSVDYLQQMAQHERDEGATVEVAPEGIPQITIQLSEWTGGYFKFQGDTVVALRNTCPEGIALEDYLLAMAVLWTENGNEGE